MTGPQGMGPLMPMVDPGPFDPGNLADLKAWYDSDDAATIQFNSGINMSGWLDKSGQGKDLVFSGNTRPQYSSASQINEKNAVLFPGLGVLIYTGNTAIDVDNCTIFIVCQTSAEATLTGILSLHSGAGNDDARTDSLVVTTGSTTKFIESARNSVAASYAGTGQTPRSVYRIEHYNGNINTYKDAVVGGTVSTAASAGTVATGGIVLGGRFLSGAVQDNNGSYDYQGNICEVIIVGNGNMSPTDISNTEIYLMNKWVSIFNYTGAAQTYTVLPNVTSVLADLYGAEGGGGTPMGAIGGLGGRLVGTLTTTPGEVLGVYVGGKGENWTAGGISNAFNGGGDSHNVNCCGGGGAADIRKGGMALTDRVAVAGGGGGAGGWAPGATEGDGGNGSGGTTAQDGGPTANPRRGQAASGTTGGAAGTGGVGSGTAGTLGEGGASGGGGSSGGGSGGGGYYGGGGGGQDFSGSTCGGGGGGNGYYNPTYFTMSSEVTGTRAGNAMVTIFIPV